MILFALILGIISVESDNSPYATDLNSESRIICDIPRIIEEGWRPRLSHVDKNMIKESSWANYLKNRMAKVKEGIFAHADSEVFFVTGPFVRRPHQMGEAIDELCIVVAAGGFVKDLQEYRKSLDFDETRDMFLAHTRVESAQEELFKLARQHLTELASKKAE